MYYIVVKGERKPDFFNPSTYGQRYSVTKKIDREITEFKKVINIDIIYDLLSSIFNDILD